MRTQPGPFRSFHQWLQQHTAYPLAHTDTALFFSILWLGLLFSFLVNVLVSYPPVNMAGWLVLAFIWFSLLPADSLLPAPATSLWLRLGYLGVETALLMALGSFDKFQVAAYLLFALIGQATFVLPLYLSVTLAGGVWVLFPVVGGWEQGIPLPSLHWAIGAFFTITAIYMMRTAREQHRRISDLLVKLEAANALVKAQAVELEQQVKEDSLTGLANRRYLDYDLPREFERAKRLQHHLTLAMADLDLFKNINDRFSHQVGDAVLVRVADILRQNCRAVVDSVVRYGGEEFVLYFPETSLPESRLVCERIRQAVESYDWSELHPDLQVTLSIGLAEAAHALNYYELLNAADIQLYYAKQSGRNQVAFASVSYPKVRP